MLFRSIAIFLIFALLSANSTRFFAYAEYELNKNYITSKLCENRNKPWLHCNGKCYLMKKIKQAEEKQSKEEQETQKNLFQEAYFESAHTIKFYTGLLQVIPLRNTHFNLPQISSAIFQPPQLG